MECPQDAKQNKVLVSTVIYATIHALTYPAQRKQYRAGGKSTAIMSGGRKKVHTTWDDIGIEMVEEYDATTDQLLLRKVKRLPVQTENHANTVRTHAHIRTYAHIPTHTHTHKHVHTQAYTHAGTQARAHAHANEHAH